MSMYFGLPLLVWIKKSALVNISSLDSEESRLKQVVVLALVQIKSNCTRSSNLVVSVVVSYRSTTIQINKLSLYKSKSWLVAESESCLLFIYVAHN